MADVPALEQQLADLAGAGGEAAAILTQLAEAIFPGGVAMGDPGRVLWPEPGRAAQAGRGDGPVPMAASNGRVPLDSQLRGSEARFRSLVEQLPAVVFYAALGAGENEAYVSPQIESLLGFTQKEWLTNPLLWYSQLHPDDHDVVIEAFTKGVQTGEPFRAQVRFFSRTGEVVWILGEARLIRDEAGRPAYFQGVAFDVTITQQAQEAIADAERAKQQAKVESARLRADAIASTNARLRQLNKELQAAKEEAEALAQARSTFLTTMSHELRTPLNSVIVLAGLLADSELTPPQHDMLRRMRLSSDHLLELINDVLEFSRLRAGHVELDRRSFDLAAWLDDTIDILAPRAAEKDLELRVAIADRVPRTLHTDKGRLRQVLLNLLGNAVKFTPQGFVEVRVGARPLTDGRWEYECTVRDSGIGIKPADAATLFDEFRQADSGIAREFGGTGLGLAICKRLCELLGGRIWVKDAGGRGVTFAFTWVAQADESSVVDQGVAKSRRSYAPPSSATLADVAIRSDLRPQTSPSPRSAPSQLRVLIAEDNLMNQQVATLLLAAMGHQADVVSDGDEAIAAVGAASYDVVLMDIAMPGTDGISATRAIRALGAEVHQPYIVALTAHAFPGDAETCIDAGMDDYVAKPIDRLQLARALAAGAQRAAGVADATGPAVPGALAGVVAVGATPVPVAGGATPNFDPSVPRGLLRDFGRRSFGELLAIFRAEAARLVGEATAAVAADDLPGAERAAHTLKSSAANLGAVGLQTSCLQLEAMARHGSLDGATAQTMAMGTQLAEALDDLDDLAALAAAEEAG